jgi:hypothetical protein
MLLFNRVIKVTKVFNTAYHLKAFIKKVTVCNQ